MDTRKQIEISKKIYRFLLGLYPREHREEYGKEMAHLFADQCREACTERGGMHLLWLKTLGDLFKSILVENFTTGQGLDGMLQAQPGSPLPWKGVVLVLIPGLVLFIAQIGQLNGEQWWYSTLSWASYAFLIPTGVVWLLRRKFPVWGLVPLGLALRNIFDQKAWNWLYLLSLNFVLPLKQYFQNETKGIRGLGELGAPLILVLLVGALAFFLFRRQKFTWRVWLYLGVFCLFICAGPVYFVVGFLKNYSLRSTAASLIPFPSFSYEFTANLLYLALISGGILLARRHGQGAILLIVGFLLPTSVYGLYQVDSYGSHSWMPPLLIGSIVFVYRFCLALIAPIFLARTRTKRWQTVVVLIPGVVAILLQLAVQIGFHIHFENSFRVPHVQYSQPYWSAGDIFSIISGPLVTMVGFMVALALYSSVPSQEQPPERNMVEVEV